MQWSLVSIEEEIERQKTDRPEPNLVGTPSKKLTYTKVFFYLFVGILLFRAITETLHFIF